jgi:DNA modification methylase
MEIKELSGLLNLSESIIMELVRKGMPINKDKTFELNIVKDWMSGEAPNLNKVEETEKKIIEKIKNDLILSEEYFINENDEIFKKTLSSDSYEEMIEFIKNLDYTDSNRNILNKFGLKFKNILKKEKRLNETYDNLLFNRTIDNDGKVKIYWGNCLDYMKKLPSESIQMMVTSPPYYNARAYSQWENINLYLEDMRLIIRESFRVLENHRVFVWNVGDIFDNDRLKTTSVWGKRRIPLSAYFIKIFEEEGFTFVDDIIWDKGEVESKRHMNGGKNVPFYQYPLNCYEHILIFHKHELDKRKIPCPVCGSLNVNGNTQSEHGLQSYECKNVKCAERSASNRGKRFSDKTNMVQYWVDEFGDSTISNNFIKNWRRDIIKLKPVFKINNKGENVLGHSAPYPYEIPEMAIRYFSYPGDVVLDPFGGSFTSCISAKNLGRIGVGCEINKEMYREAIIGKINNETNFLDNNHNYLELN